MICPTTGKRAVAAPSKSGRALRGIDLVVERAGHHERRVARGVAVAERVHVVGERPAVRLAHGVVERRHRRPVEAGAEGAEDVLARRAAAEGPAPGEVGGAQRVAEVVLQRRRRGPVAAPRLAVAAHAAERAVELLALLDRLLGGRGRLRQRDRLAGLGRDRRTRRRSVFRYCTTPSTSASLSRGQAGIEVYGIPSRITRFRSSSVGSVPEGVVRILNLPAVKSRGRGRRCTAPGPCPSPFSPWHWAQCSS